LPTHPNLLQLKLRANRTSENDLHPYSYICRSPKFPLVYLYHDSWHWNFELLQNIWFRTGTREIPKTPLNYCILHKALLIIHFPMLSWDINLTST
jgi:hypothetical protein